MPLIQFATSPTRQSAIQHDGRPHHAGIRSPPPPPQTQQQQQPQQQQCTPADANEFPIDQHGLTPSPQQAELLEPLTFEKRILPRTPSSQEPVQKSPTTSSPSQTASSVPKTDVQSHEALLPTQAGLTVSTARETKSLLTDALATNKSPRPCLLPAVSSGILRKDCGAKSPTSNANPRDAQGRADDTKVSRAPLTPVTPLRTHFVEPEKPRRPQPSSPPPPPASARSLAAAAQRSSSAQDATTDKALAQETGRNRQTTVRLHRSERPDHSHLSLTEARVASLGSEAPILTRRRCLVFQESTDVLERAAERARLAKQFQSETGRATRPAAGPVPKSSISDEYSDAVAPSVDPARRRGSQHSTSSTGEESCSTRSSFVPRGSSPPTSSTASPVASLTSADKLLSESEEEEEEDEEEDEEGGGANTEEDDDDDDDDDDDGTPARTPSTEAPTFIASVPKPSASTPRPVAAASVTAAPAVAVADRTPRLTFAQPPQELSACRRESKALESTQLPPTLARLEASASLVPRRPRLLSRARTEQPAQELPGGLAEAVSEQAGASSTKRSLSFTVCPLPERERKGSQAPRGKLAGSPAPNMLSYKQRVRGMRGGGPILSSASHAADRAFKPSSIALPAASASGSGYSEDDSEDDSDDDDSEDDTDSDVDTGEDADSDADSLSNVDVDAAEDVDEFEGLDEEESEAASGVAKGLVAADIGLPHGKLSTKSTARTLLAAGPDGRAQVSDSFSSNRLKAGFFDAFKRRTLSQGDAAERRGSTVHHFVGATKAGPMSPLRGDRGPAHVAAPRRRSPAPRSASHVGPTLALKDSSTFSHPMCFLPDTFEDSAPVSPALSSHVDAVEGVAGPNAQHYTSDIGSGPSSRRCSWQYAAGGGGPVGTTNGGTPLSLPFHRGRDRTLASGPISDAEAYGLPAGWRGPSWMQAHLHQGKQPLGSAATGADSSQEIAGPSSLGLTFDGMPARPHRMRNASSKAVDDYQRAWSSLNRRDSSGVALPVGANVVSPSRITAPSSSVSLMVGGTLSPRSPPSRPASAQRALPTASQVRCRPSVAQCSTAAVVGATSPPRENAMAHLKLYFDHQPAAFGDVSRASEVTTPASGTQSPVLGGGAGAAAARYWNETLSALAQAMGGETAAGGDHGDPARQGYLSEPGEYSRHGRSRSVPLDAYPDSQDCEALPRRDYDQPEGVQAAVGVDGGREHALSPVPRPIRIAPPPAAWTSDRDGEGPMRQPGRVRRRPKSKKQTRTAKSQGASPPPLLDYMCRKVGAGGRTRLEVAAEDNEQQQQQLRPRRKKKTSATSMEFNWGRCKITNPKAAEADNRGERV